MRHREAIDEFCRALRREYGNAISQIIVFGSVAREEDNAGSDIDVMVVMDAEKQVVNWQLEHAVRGVALSVELEQNVVFDLKVIASDDWQGLRGHTPFMERVAEEGVAV